MPAGASRTIWFTVAGSDQGLSDAQAQFQAASADPAGELTAKLAARQQVDGRTQLSLPGDPALAESATWSKQDLADLTQQADNLQIRDTQEGTVYPAPIGSLPSIRFEGAGFPDYPWMFATDQEYTVFALLAAGQFETAMDGLANGDDLWPDGAGNVESSVLGADAVDVAVYTIRGLYDLADMAASKGDTATQQWADSHAAAMVQRFSGAWWLPGIPQFADSLSDPANTPLMQRWWTGVTPMEAELYPHGVPQPGPRAAIRGAARPGASPDLACAHRRQLINRAIRSALRTRAASGVSWHFWFMLVAR